MNRDTIHFKPISSRPFEHKFHYRFCHLLSPNFYKFIIYLHIVGSFEGLNI